MTTNGTIEPGYYWVKLKNQPDDWVIGYFRNDEVFKEWSILDRWPLYEPEEIKFIGPRIHPPDSSDISIKELLKQLTTYVRRTEGTEEALSFFVDYIQPIEQRCTKNEPLK